MNASEAGGNLVLECQYNTDLFDAETIRHRMEEFEVLLTGIVADANQPISLLPILREAEHKLLVEWNETQADYPFDKCIHQLFDIAVLELFLPLVVGAKVVLVSQEVASDGRKLLQQLSDSRPTFMQATPATWRMLLAAGWQGSPQMTIRCGGEALLHQLAQQLRQRGAALWNLYGPTETTIWSTTERVDDQEGAVSIGRPIANTQIYILLKDKNKSLIVGDH